MEQRTYQFSNLEKRIWSNTFDALLALQKQAAEEVDLEKHKTQSKVGTRLMLARKIFEALFLVPGYLKPVHDAAHSCGLSRNGLYVWLNEVGIDRDTIKSSPTFLDFLQKLERIRSEMRKIGIDLDSIITKATQVNQAE